MLFKSTLFSLGIFLSACSLAESDVEFEPRIMKGAEVSDAYSFFYLMKSLIRAEFDEGAKMTEAVYYKLNEEPYPQKPEATYIPPLEQRRFTVEDTTAATIEMYRAFREIRKKQKEQRVESLCSRDADLMTAPQLSKLENRLQRRQEKIIDRSYRKLIKDMNESLANALQNWVEDFKHGMIVKESDYLAIRTERKIDAKDLQFRFCSQKEG